MMDIQHRIEGSKGAWYIERDGDVLAEMTYSRLGEDKIIIDHTAVSDTLRGQGVGKALVKTAVDWARDQSVAIIPLCPFAKATLQRHPEWQDVVAA